jgi:hypothetical protein
MHLEEERAEQAKRTGAEIARDCRVRLNNERAKKVIAVAMLDAKRVANLRLALESVLEVVEEALANRSQLHVDDERYQIANTARLALAYDDTASDASPAG